MSGIDHFGNVCNFWNNFGIVVLELYTISSDDQLRTCIFSELSNLEMYWMRKGKHFCRALKSAIGEQATCLMSMIGNAVGAVQ